MSDDLTETRIALLQQMPVFGGLNYDSLRLLLSAARDVRVAAGEHFFHEGEPGDCLYVLEAGAAEVHKRAPDGHPVKLMELRAGDHFGEMSLVDLGPRSTSIRASADCRAFTITPDGLLSLYQHSLEQFTLIQMNLGREMCRRLRAAHLDLRKV